MLKIGSIGLSFIYNLLNGDSEEKDDIDNNKNSRHESTNIGKVKALRKTLEKHGGVFSKVAQLLSYSEHEQSVFSDCEPFSRNKTHLYFQKYVENNDLKYNVNSENIYKSGSVGQVYIGSFKTDNTPDTSIAVKVQYVGLYEKTEGDLNALELLGNFLFSFIDIRNALKEIQIKIYEELNYDMELQNHQLMYKLWDNNVSGIIIPKVFPQFSTDKILVTEFLKGVDISTFIKNASQENKNKIGCDMIKFIFENIYKHKIFYADIHYGNVIIQDDNKLGIIDFGCINKLESEIVDDCKKLHISLCNQDEKSFYQIIENLGITNEHTSKKSKECAYKYFNTIFKPFIVREKFKFTSDFILNEIGKGDDHPDIKYMKEWILPTNMVYFNKIPHGLYHMLSNLNAEGEFYKIFDDILGLEEESGEGEKEIR